MTLNLNIDLNMGNCEKNCLQPSTKSSFEVLKENMPPVVNQTRERLSFKNSNTSISSNLQSKNSYSKLTEISHKPTQQNVVNFENGCTYEGDWDPQLKRHGFGVYMWNDGSKYTGYWSDNSACGFGKLEHANGEVYEGNWMNDKVEGYGEYSGIDGMSYKGQWKNDLQHGPGFEVWEKISTYEGQFREGKKCGHGVLKFEDGSEYDVG